LTEDRSHAGNDKDEMADAANGHHHGVELANLARVQKRPKQPCPCLKIVGYEQPKTVPKERYGKSRAKTPRAVAMCQSSFPLLTGKANS
jgi:hypothetical protein